ncbi:glyceraldehyde-3-phosphate dehydrogenase [Thermoplasma volcanium GSS1]|uniref:Glyceraldehyde-3-phosphate dehydrogenase n=1 Tax=Thermoplasma volcanium (strain ATCC 51530 / DSM 4299 / JCM 9571 / NBRC 15438 / GSS1) TaxID=273116 RepID=G3P_THEVO|nr:type II glyceraldehyde-3-phosphate dehydrogenase [Thermoplasma volcanium]Q97BJ8.1 RecName: Full=Glyceraldehyde-3-phosphate dehydrogenase; Short=GAPDH; AltName: Full=NAD(P)-dependent glyceraldehyde-3-phosphate dehydrogenase [Thermoplasma volcanium GSS1]BAB59599.1 glyceraldehyde-3-phosphate dehydrogenase [Thermoplasma volcanium GSS1]
MIRVGINGYGTIGRRVANAVSSQDDMIVVGIVKTKPDYISEVASRRFKIFVPDSSYMKAFQDAGIKVEGTLDNLLDDAEIIVDATPEGMGEKNKPLYIKKKAKAIFEGGEEPDVAETSFNAYSNYNDAIGKSYVRVVSCNTTGLARTLYPIQQAFGVKHVEATLIRRATDQNDSSKGPINAVEPSLKIPSHHAPDLKTVMGNIDVNTVAIKVPTTLMHVHVVQVDTEKNASNDGVLEAWNNYRRIIHVKKDDGIKSTAQIMDLAREFGRDRSDLYEIAIWEGSVSAKANRISYIQAVHQESDVIPENVDAIRAMFNLADKEKSIEKTDKSLGIEKRVY